MKLLIAALLALSTVRPVRYVAFRKACVMGPPGGHQGTKGRSGAWRGSALAVLAAELE